MYTRPFPHKLPTLTDCAALSTLVVNPAFRRRGAGAPLVQDGITRAHTVGLPLFVCGSPSGACLYERLGFVLQETLELTHAKDLSAMFVKEVPQAQ